MSSLAGRLRGIVGSARPSASRTADTPDARVGSAEGHQALNPVETADSLDGEWVQAGSHRFLVVRRSYAPGHRHGTQSIADGLPPAEGWSRLPVLAGAPCGRNLLFVDLETTGLAGGAGSYAFLVGCGWFDRGRFQISQFLLSSFASEGALLKAVAEVADTADTLVTYNGKSFDLPLIETRYALNRLSTPFAEMPHVDMLHHARRLWHDGDDGHRLVGLEASLLGHAREGDVPGFEIPSRYFHYVRTGDARPLGAVLEHNRLDLLSLALLTTRAALLLETGPDGAATPREAYGLGMLYERSGLTAEALACFARAMDMGPAVSPEAIRAYALLCRRTRRYGAAASAWQRLLSLRDCPPRMQREAAEALAVHHEHRLRDLRAARTLAIRSLQLDATASRRQATEHRLARLERKLTSASPDGAALF